MNMRRIVFWLLVAANFVVMVAQARAQALPASDNSASPAVTAPPVQTPPAYVRPDPAKRFGNYAFDAFGPYAVVGAAFTAGINQESNTPPEWRQGAEAYGKRFGSNYGMSAVSTTTRYALSEVFREDAAYYPCDCKGVFPRLRHAVISSVTARRGKDGHRVFSFPAVAAPYAGSMTTVYGWYPNRYGAKDALRIGSYNLLGTVAGNIASEFLQHRLHSMFHHVHANGERQPSYPNEQPAPAEN